MTWLETLVEAESPLAHAGSLCINVNTNSMNGKHLSHLRFLCNQLASDRLLVEHCSVTLEGSSSPLRRLEFKTFLPIRLWRKIQCVVYADETLHGFLLQHSFAYWLGDANYHDFIWLYRTFGGDTECDGFLFRFCCIDCGQHYSVSRGDDARCPHCQETD